MIIRIEPKDWNMHTVLMFFNEEEPHSEDARHSPLSRRASLGAAPGSTTLSLRARSSRCGLMAAATSDVT